MQLSVLKRERAITGSIGGRPVAVFYDDGKLTVLENICPHLKCETKWRSREMLWECACHGSKFGARGELLKGPAQTGLKELAYEVVDDEIHLKE